MKNKKLCLFYTFSPELYLFNQAYETNLFSLILARLGMRIVLLKNNNLVAINYNDIMMYNFCYTS